MRGVFEWCVDSRSKYEKKLKSDSVKLNVSQEQGAIFLGFELSYWHLWAKCKCLQLVFGGVGKLHCFKIAQCKLLDRKSGVYKSKPRVVDNM